VTSRSSVLGPTSPDRRTISSGRAWALTVLVGVQLWTAMSSLPLDPANGRTFTAEAGALCAVLAVFGLKSVPIRWIVRASVVASGLLLARFGELGVQDGVAGSWRGLLWVGAAGAGLALAPSSRAVPGVPGGMVIRAEDVPAVGGAVRGSGAPDPVRRSVSVALVVAAVAAVGASSLLLGPRTANRFPTGSSAGDLVDLGDVGQNSPLLASDRLDMTSRPRLSDEVVMTARSPIASFWRAEVYDVWDGSTWTRSDEGSGSLLDRGRVTPSPDDLSATRGVPSEQQFRIEVGVASAVPTAPSAVRVDSTQQLAQRPDGTLVTAARPLSRGTTYTVQSRQLSVSPAELRSAAGEVPDEVAERYARAPVATERVAELTESVVAGAGNDYDRVRAIERWMDGNTRYSLDAPLAPAGVDVVDDFLFESREGWCEQIASSLVVMARLAGVPARLATGFAPGEWDAVGGRFVVRERDAHAWAEVWFPDFGWVTFDPTAQVPLAGTTASTPGAAAFDWREVAGVALLVVAAGALIAGPLRQRLARRRPRARTRTGASGRSDAARREREIEHRGESVGRRRLAHETISTYARAVAADSGDDTVAQDGDELDHSYYAQGTASH
jgi:transglutaminase-like putative cysteine protease